MLQHAQAEQGQHRPLQEINSYGMPLLRQRVIGKTFFWSDPYCPQNLDGTGDYALHPHTWSPSPPPLSMAQVLFRVTMLLRL